MATKKNKKGKESHQRNRPGPSLRSQSGTMDEGQVKHARTVTFSIEEKNRDRHVIIKKSNGHYSYKEIEKNLSLVSFDWNDDSRGFDLVSVIREGIDYKLFRKVAEYLPFSDNDWALFLDTTKRTLERYKKDNKKFSPKQSETIIEIKQLMKFGEEVFGDPNNFHTWLLMESVALGGAVPKELLDTSVGLGIVRDELGRIDYGIFA